jgi:UDP-N-acetylmuramate--alanine ligase
VSEPRPALALDQLSAVHLIGIGGAGMSALAKVLLARGAEVSGSDLKESRGIVALRALGARIAVGHRADNLDGARCVVVSSAIPPSNTELRTAGERGIPVLQRAQVLALLMHERRGIAVAGTHGKTTTTSMIALMLQNAGLAPTFLIGGDLNETGSNAHHGEGEWLVAEADESDGSFLWLSPEIAVVTNIEADHLDYYRDETEIRETFLVFLHNLAPDGIAVVCADDSGVQQIMPRVPRRVVTYGITAGEWRGEVIGTDANGTRFAVRRNGSSLGEITVGAPGRHNVSNALAAIAVADLVGIGVEAAAAQLAAYQGVQRRFQPRGAAAGVALVDDYAHHPTEIAATLAAARDRGYERIVAIFQPHRYSRTQHLGRALGAALSAADRVVVTDVYGAGEEPLPGVTGRLVVDGVLEAAPRARVAYLPKRANIAPYALRVAEPGDLVLTLGAGDITMIADEILLGLIEREASASSR